MQIDLTNNKDMVPKTLLFYLETKLYIKVVKATSKKSEPPSGDKKKIISNLFFIISLLNYC